MTDDLQQRLDRYTKRINQGAERLRCGQFDFRRLRVEDGTKLLARQARKSRSEGANREES